MQPTYEAPWDKFKPYVITGLILLVVAYVGYFIATHGFIEVSIEGASENSQTLSLRNQKTDEKSTITTTSNTIRRFVSKADYEIFVTSAKGSSWQQVQAPGFLQSTSAIAKLQPERKRTFVATDPRGCMTYNEQLVSYTCGTLVSDVVVHQASSATIPPTARQGIDGLNGNLQSLVTTPGGTVALLQTYEGGEEEGLPTYRLVSLAPGSFSPASAPVEITAIEGGGEYYAKPYNNGLLVYKEDYSDLLYFSSPQTPAERLTRPAVDRLLSAQSLVTSTSAAIITYKPGSGEQEDSVADAPQTPLTLVIYRPGKAMQQLTLPAGWLNALPCGSNIICATSIVNERQFMAVLDMSGSKPKELFRVNKVSQLVRSLPDGVLVATDQGLLRINTTTQSGSVDYSFGDYSLCGVGDTPNPAEYVLCITQGNQTAALLVQEAADPNQIDKKVAALRNNKSVDTVTADRNNLFIVPNTGEDVYNEEEQLFLPDPTKVAAAQQAIQTQVGQLGLKDLGYNIVTY